MSLLNFVFQISLLFFLEMIFNDFVEYDGWFDDAWHVMISFWTYMMMHTWMRGYMGEICFFHFLFFLYFNLRARKTRLKARKKTALEARQN